MTKRNKAIDAWSIVIIFSCIILDGALWSTILSGISLQTVRIYFFNVTQGSSELIALSNNIKIMVDAGGDDSIVQNIDAALAPNNDRYINLAVISYPQINNYGGYNYILDHYQIGAFVYDGRNDTSYSKTWQQFLQKLQAKNIPLITLSKGDGIHYGKNRITILSPNSDLAQSADTSDAALVEKVATPDFTILLASDIGTNPGRDLLSYGANLKSTIIKLPYPLAGQSLSQEFLSDVDPRAMILSPGTKNSDSALSKAMITALASSTKVPIFQPATQGTIMVSLSDGNIVFSKGK